MNECRQRNLLIRLRRQCNPKFLAMVQKLLPWWQHRFHCIWPRKGNFVIIQRLGTMTLTWDTTITHWFTQASCQVNNRDVRSRNSKSHTSQFAVQIRNDFTNLGRTNLLFCLTLNERELTALAAPVDDGIMFWAAPRPPRQSCKKKRESWDHHEIRQMKFCLALFDGPSTVFCVAVYEWTVVIKASTMPNFSWTTLAKGAKQFVVHDALETTVSFPVYLSSLTPMTNIGASADGAVMTTFLAPACKCGWHLSTVVKTPVDSTMYSAPEIDEKFLSRKFRFSEKLTESSPRNFRWILSEKQFEWFVGFT